MDHRLHTRFVVDRVFECRVGGRPDWVFLYDLSAGGCMFEVSCGPVEVDNYVFLKLTHYIEVRGRVCWCINRNVGVRFEEQLPDRLVEQLGFTPAVHAFEDILPRDRFGRPLPKLPLPRSARHQIL